MTKSELKTGMIVVLADGNKYMVFKNTQTHYAGDADIIVGIHSRNSWHQLYHYNEDMTRKNREDSNWDIIEVIQIEHPYNLVKPDRLDYPRRKTLWKRHEKKKYTYAQLREILGEEFEVVG
jgi:hypothetical protein